MEKLLLMLLNEFTIAAFFFSLHFSSVNYVKINNHQKANKILFFSITKFLKRNFFFSSSQQK